MIFSGQPAGSRIGFLVLTGVENLNKIELLHDFGISAVGARITEAHIFFSAGMGWPQNAAVGMDDGDQDIDRKAAQLKDTKLDSLRDNDQNMTAAAGIVFDAFKDLEVCVLFVLQMLFPVTVTVVGIMVSDDHSAKAFFLQQSDIFFYRYPAVQGSFLHMAVHVDFHYILIVAFFDIFEKGKLFFIMSFLFGNVNGRINGAAEPAQKEKKQEG